ncbi:hypothetical protein HK103_005195 [Boothiomyces macroporosus]|uniref:Uncharacterized protein n=1 Tax=Boothiomyces macroporosus TaxID=261099 RepID=A0AAD5Y7X6_9FUNG|nr:hypothetical protein HK103_005195 [Boothiomyces macroporosus]
MVQISIKIKCSNESAFSVSVDSEASTLQLKNEISKHFQNSSPTPPEQQRLIFAGKVLKDEELLSVYKVQDGNTIHLVRGNAPKATAPPSATTPTANPTTTPNPTTTTANPPNPMNMFGAPGSVPNFGMPSGMGGMPGGIGGAPNMESMLSNPMFMQMMSQMMSNPQMLDMMIQSNPQLAATITPEMRQHMQSPQFQQMMSNPEILRMMLQMQGGMGGMGAGFNPTNNMFGQPPTFNNPYASSPTSAPQPTMPAFNPALLQMMMGQQAQPTQPAQPPEVLYQTQLAQLQDMGFFNAAENIRALQMTGGNVEAAVEWLFSHPPGQL